MSIKKAISLSILLLANMVMLAHSLIPHHHHNQIPVAVCISHAEHAGDAHKHHHADTHPINHCADPDNHCHELSEDCLLEKAYIKVRNDK